MTETILQVILDNETATDRARAEVAADKVEIDREYIETSLAEGEAKLDFLKNFVSFGFYDIDEDSIMLISADAVTVEDKVETVTTLNGMEFDIDYVALTI